MKATFTILGCASSAGVPGIGNFWGNCDSANPKNRRSRACAAIVSESTALIIDTGPDFREQYNRSGLQTLNGVLYTHMHGDHVHGIDELRTFNRVTGNKVDIYGQPQALEVLRDKFDYMFETSGQGFYPAVLEAHALNMNTAQRIGDLTFTPFAQDHGTCISTGFRFGNIGYSTDFVRLDKTALNILEGIEIWIADAAAYHNTNNPVHACIEAVMAYNERIGAQKVYLTDLPPVMDYETVLNELPDGFEPAYDGLSLETRL